MTSKDFAKLIPAEYRKEILDPELNIIANAAATSSDSNMRYLTVIWKNYIEPGFQEGCGMCYQRVLDNFRALQNDLIELELQAKLMAEIII